MNPIEAPELVDNGIVVFTPSLVNLNKIKLSIFYSPQNPLFSWNFCTGNPYKIWEKEDINFDKGILFIYKTNANLKKGFYKIHVRYTNSSNTVSKEGEQVYGILEDNKPNLYIGLPYSSFNPVGVT